MNIVMFGPPAAGKGTQAKKLVSKHSLLQLSTGDMLRQARASGTELGEKVSGIMDRGELVSDEIVISLIEEQISSNKDNRGFIFDGFPRTVAQAEALDALMGLYDSQIDVVVSLKVDDSSLINRITKRFKEEGRADDNPESFKVRLNAYNTQTASLLPYYLSQRKLHEVDGMLSINEVSVLINEALKNKNKE
ncbi:MAG: adenylate kinase [Hellea sp.]